MFKNRGNAAVSISRCVLEAVNRRQLQQSGTDRCQMATVKRPLKKQALNLPYEGWNPRRRMRRRGFNKRLQQEISLRLNKLKCSGFDASNRSENWISR